MDIDRISAGRAPPGEINVFVEIQQGGLVKYELDPVSGALVVDRFLETSMAYPGNYGFVPQTLSEDGDPLDALVVGAGPVMPGAVVRCRPVGALMTEDEYGPDAKIVAVPLGPHPPELSLGLRSQITHFFAHYKDLEAAKWVRIIGWADSAEARRLIEAALGRAARQRRAP